MNSSFKQLKDFGAKVAVYTAEQDIRNKMLASHDISFSVSYIVLCGEYKMLNVESQFCFKIQHAL